MPWVRNPLPISGNTRAIPSTAVVTQLLNALIASGGADLDYSALATVVFGLAGLDEGTA